MEKHHDRSDEAVASRALAGDREAWDALIARHGQRVLLALLARGVRLDHANDVVQETWARLIAQQRAGKLERLELPGLAITQAIFLAHDLARRKRGDTIPIDDAPEIATVADPAPSIERRLATRQQLARARVELEKRSPRTQKVFELVYDEPGLSHAEAARIVGLSVQRVRQTLCEIRAALRAALESSDE